MLPLGKARRISGCRTPAGKPFSLADFKDKPALLVIFMCNTAPT